MNADARTDDFTTVVDYAYCQGIRLDELEAFRLGHKASRYSQLNKLPINNKECSLSLPLLAAYGHFYTFHPRALAHVFANR